MKLLTALVAVLCAISVGALLHLASGIFIPLVIAWFMLQIFSPILALGRKLKLPPAVNLLLVSIIFLGVCYLGVVFSANQIVEFNRIFAEYSPKLNEMVFNIMAALQIPPEALLNINWLDILRQHLLDISGMVYDLFAHIFLILIFFMLMLLEAPSLGNKIDMAFSEHTSAKIKNIMSSIAYEISSYLGTLTLIGLATGVCVWIILAVIGVELAAGWAVLAFFMNYIPNIGAVISTALPVAMAVLQFSPGYVQPAVVLLLVSGVQFVFGNIVAPKMLGDKLGLSPVVIMISFLVWGTIWGIAGAILSVPIASIIKIVCENVPPLKPIAILMGNGRERRQV